MPYVTPQIIVGWSNLFDAKLRKNPKPTDKPKYSVTTLFTQEAYDDALTKAILAAVQECAVQKWGLEKFKVMVEEGKFENPFKRDVTSKGMPKHIVRYVSSDANVDYPPAVLGRDAKPITDKREVYIGTVGRVSLEPRAYGGPGTDYSAGVKLDLRNFQKLGDGDRFSLGSGGADGSEFGALAPLPAADMPGGAVLDPSMLE